MSSDEDYGGDFSLIVNNLTKSYGSFTAVDNLSMKVKKGEFMGLLGPNGAGKSTTLKAITGLLTPTAGEIYVNGVDARKHRAAMRHVGCVIETPESYHDFTPTEMMLYVGHVHGLSTKEIKIRARDVLEEVRMWSWRDKNIGSFSKGMRQRVALAAAMLPNPDLIILDEPTSGLDPRGMIEIRRTLNALKSRDMSLLISTHILKEVSEMCTSMTMINHGKTVISGDVNTLVHNLAKDENAVNIELRMLGTLTPTFISDITAMSGVSNLERTGERSIKFGFTGTDEQQADIVDLVYSHKLRLLCMNESGADLESLYMKLTEESEVNVR
ncbi:MAG: ABC transporter ATP-binding protein [Candidatus Methanomethylophilaceae archaeon]|nr:ABC transporter ATP-binding protein [Candidatus Methanomethylophilaceae archaeon]